MKNFLATVCFLFLCSFIYAQNPVIAGYYADPSIKVINSKYYMYVTTDGYPPYGNLGETFVWTSSNLIDWKPETLRGLPDKTIWAPALIKGKDGKYYLYCQNSVDYSGYVWKGDSPTGPFVRMAHLGGFDLEPFLDPVSGKIYVVSATQEIFEMDNDIHSPTYLTKIRKHIPLSGLFDYTEGPFIFYRNGLYYALWSGGRCWLKSYNVRYATSKNIEGPYTDGEFNPIIKTDEKAGIVGPGHCSIIKIEGKYFIFYHREDNDKAPTCNYRLTCVSEIKFDDQGQIHLTKYIDNLGAYLGKKSDYEDIALHKDVFANSESGNYRAQNAVDGKNYTRWTTGEKESGILTVDLGKIEHADRVEIDFEYADKWVTCKTEYSVDNIHWDMLSDHSTEAVKGYQVMFVDKPFQARYVRLTILNSEDRNASVWELKILKKRT